MQKLLIRRKTELLKYDTGADFYLADLGIPSEVYAKFGIVQPKEFMNSGLLYIKKRK